MTRAIQQLPWLLLVTFAAGCGSSSSNGFPVASAVAPVTSNPTPTPTPTQIQDVHGQIVQVGQSLAFLEDGAVEARELTSPAALVSAGAYVRKTLVVSGDVSTPNAVGQTALSASLAVTSFQLDGIAVTGRLQQSTFFTFEGNDGKSYEPIGPMAASLLQEPIDTPIRVTGRIDPTHTSASGGAGLEVTSWRATAEVTMTLAGGMVGVKDVFTVDDLLGSGAQRYDLSYRTNFGNTRTGEGWLSEADLASLATTVAAANLRTQPTVFRQTMLVFDIPTQYIDYADRNGSLRITILRPTTLPPELDALIAKMGALHQGVANARTLDSGIVSQVTTPGTQTIRDQAAFDSMWAQHAPGSQAPTVDFTKEYVVALFMGTRSTGGYSIGVERALRVGDAIRLETRRTAPTGVATQIITAPFSIVAVDHRGASQGLYIDGVKQ